MSADFNDILRQGYLKVKSKNIGVWNKRWVILKKASSKGPTRLEKYQDENTASIQKDDSKHIPLGDVKNVFRLPSDVKKHAFAVMFCDKSSRQFACDSEFEADEWQKLLENECLKANVAVSQPSVFQNGSEMFNVYLVPSPQLNIFGECLLDVSAEHLVLYDVADTQHELVSWPLTSLRRYGKDTSKFTIEAGRFCKTGEGMFLFNTSEAGIIYQKVHSASVAISEAHRLTSRKTEQSPPSTLTRGSSEQGPADRLDHAPLQISHSFPYTADIRAPEPLPRDIEYPAPPVPDRPRGSIDQGMPNNTFATGSTFQVSYKQVSKSTNNNNTSPMATVVNGNGNNEDEMYIYEEKGLNPEFRKFLAGRKADD